MYVCAVKRGCSGNALQISLAAASFSCSLKFIHDSVEIRTSHHRTVMQEQAGSGRHVYKSVQLGDADFFWHGALGAASVKRFESALWQPK